MVFNSLAFMFFLAAVLLIDRLPLPWTFRKFNLLCASLLFYSAWYPPAVVLLLLTLSLDYVLAHLIERTSSARRRRVLLIGSLVANFGVLGFFKYANFVYENLSQLASALHWTAPHWQESVFLPLGISFYTFQSVSYVVDVYRRDAKPCRSYLDFALYVSFFPHLVAGPIVRYADFGPQLDTPKRATVNQISEGLLLLTAGLFLKVTLSDSVFAPIAEAAYTAASGDVSKLSMDAAWAGILAFAGQLYCDFGGYSICAVGLARCFGLHFPWNFRAPFGATSFTEFWTRWHISLSSWIRDYIYYPLGGSRCGQTRTARNLMLAFVFSGFWHGASWTFGIWGAVHGVILVAEKMAARTRLSGFVRYVPAAARALGVSVVFALSLTFFRAPNVTTALRLLANAFTPNASSTVFNASMFPWQVQLAFVTFAALVGFHYWVRNRGAIERLRDWPVPLQSTVAASLVVIMLTSLPEKGHVFIYFQF